MERVLSYKLSPGITPLSAEELNLVAGGDPEPTEPHHTLPYPTDDPTAPDRPPKSDGGGLDVDG